MKDQVMIKPDLIEVSTTEQDYAKITALYLLDQQGITANKKNLRKKTNDFLKLLYEKKKYSTKLFTAPTVITLKCSNTNEEIGYCLFEPYDTYDSLDFVFVRKEYRGYGYSKKLINHFEQQSRKLKLIKLTDENKIVGKKIFKDFGYDYLHDFRCEKVITLIKRCEINELEKAIELQTYKELFHQTTLFVKTKQKIDMITDNCLYLSDYLKIADEIFNIFKDDVSSELTEFFDFMLTCYEKEHPMAQFIYHCLDAIEEAA